MATTVAANGIDFEDFRTVATEAVKEHEDLQSNFKIKTIEVEELQTRLAETEELLNKLKDVSKTAVADLQIEYETHLEREQVLKETAMEYATSMVQENKKIKKEKAVLKRQSMAIIQNLGGDITVMDISIDDDGDEPDSVEEGDVTPLRKEIEILKSQMEDLTHELVVSKQINADLKRDSDETVRELEELSKNYEILQKQYEKEREAHELATLSLKERDKTIEQFNRVSTLVMQEIQEVAEKYEEESVLRQKAEEFAAQMYSEKTAADEFKRQSVMLLNTEVPMDDKVTQMMLDIEDLTKKLEEEKQSHKREVEDLLSQVKEIETVEEMQKQLEDLENKLRLSDLRVNDLENINRRVQKQLDDEIEKNKPFIPPAPPPPPPQVNKNPLARIRKKFKSKESSGNSGNSDSADPNQKKHEAMIDEMMKKIKTGKVGLKSIPNTPKPSSSSKSGSEAIQKSKAVEDLDSILRQIKAHQATDGRHLSKKNSLDKSIVGGAADFQEFMKRRRERTDVSVHEELRTKEPSKANPSDQSSHTSRTNQFNKTKEPSKANPSDQSSHASRTNQSNKTKEPSKANPSDQSSHTSRTNQSNKTKEPSKANPSDQSSHTSRTNQSNKTKEPSKANPSDQSSHASRTNQSNKSGVKGQQENENRPTPVPATRSSKPRKPQRTRTGSKEEDAAMAGYSLVRPNRRIPSSSQPPKPTPRKEDPYEEIPGGTQAFDVQENPAYDTANSRQGNGEAIYSEVGTRLK